MKLALMSDLHGILPKHVDCDLAIVAGDICPECHRSPHVQQSWVREKFLPWISKFPKAVFVAGNHDYLFERQDLLDEFPRLPPHIAYLKDRMGTLAGLHIWGCPWSLPYGAYAFMAEERMIAEKLQIKGLNPDIIISHGPPFGHCDKVFRYRYNAFENTGSKALLDRIRWEKPKLVVCGHIHEGRGVSYEGDTLIVNAAMAGEHVGLGLEYPPILIDLNDNGVVGLTL